MGDAGTVTGPTDRFPHSDPRTARLPAAPPHTARLEAAPARLTAGAVTVPLHARTGGHYEPAQPAHRGPQPGRADGRQPDAASGDYPTEPFGRPHTADDEPKPSGFWRELSGALTLGLCVLALVVLGLQALASSKGMPGPGFPVVLGHVVAAIAAVVLQRQADRRLGSVAALPVLLVTAVTAATTWFFWWS
jgi:hypothetical protein